VLSIEATSNPELELWATERKVDLLSRVLKTQIAVRGPNH
jgi:hypothetical protein